ncbi:MAG: sulfatase-like hydrolase/transferase [Rhodothermales bacterium]
MSLRFFWAGLLLFAGVSCQSPAPDRPNILWITAEDMSPVLGYLGDTYAITPNIDRLAGESVIYTNAFATAPVCSPSRAALINGIMASIQGAQQMRSAYPIPDAWIGFPAYLRQAGYYTTNNVKTDYNSANEAAIIAASWDESSDTAGWQGRRGDQPFFSIFNQMVSHQSRTMAWPYEQFVREVQSRLAPDEIHDPAAAPVPPYYPDTPVIRRTIARFYDCVTVLDHEVGEILQRLEDDGLMDDTIIFFYSDHGSGMPRHKRVLLDSGMAVPLLVRFPEKYRHLAPAGPGERVDRLVNFEDFGPTVLSLAGVPIPEYMQGQAFLGGAETAPRAYVFGHRDRIDEAVDMSRSVRDKRYLYVRNYMPHLSYNQFSAWADEGEVNHEFYAMKPEDMSDAVRQFAGPTKPREALFDTQADPLNLNNLAASGSHQDVLQRMRGVLNDYLVDHRDLGFVPEVEMRRMGMGTTAYDWARSGAYDVTAHIAAAEAVGTDDFARFREALQSEAPGIRYWGAMGYTAASQLPAQEVGALRAALADPSAIVRIEAASALLQHGRAGEALPVLTELLHDDDLWVVTYAARALELGGEASRPAYAELKALHDRYQGTMDVPEWLVVFSTTGFMNRVQP